MRLRCIAFLPPAALVTGLIFLLTSVLMAKFESGIESNFSTSEVPDPIALVRYETQCERLERQIREVARDVSSCEALPGCLRSENICPVSMAAELARTYDRLRVTASERCTGLKTYVTQVSASCTSDGMGCGTELCAAPPASNRSESAKSGLFLESSPGVFVF